MLISDTTTDERRQPWVREAAAAGVRSVLSISLPVHDTVIGAVTVYSEIPEAFDDSTITLAQTFAGYATVALANAYLYDTNAGLAEHMRKAMEHRAVIEQAKGIIMAERRCSPDQAFAILTRLSQDSNRKVRDVAAAIVARSAQPGGSRRHTPGDPQPRATGQV